MMVAMNPETFANALDPAHHECKPWTPRLSKSRIQSGRQCHKRLWLEIHQPDAVQWDGAARARLDEGTAFGELARDLLGGGLLIDADHWHVPEALAKTRDALAHPCEDTPRLFEAAFEFDDVRVRVDALERGAESDTLIEVKSSTRAKEEYVWDCAIQTWVLRGAGRPVRKIALALVNKEFLYTRPGDYDGLLVVEDITPQVETLLPRIAGIVAQLKAVAAGPAPATATGAHCHAPYACPLIAHCRANEPSPSEHHAELRPRGETLVEQWHAKGHVDRRDVHDALAWPRFYLGFETIRPVIPRWPGTRPFERLPFQFSCHVENEAGELRHEAFIDLSGNLPLASLTDHLIDVLGDDGPILVWNRSSAANCIRALIKRLPDKGEALLRIADRLLDLQSIFHENHHHCDTRGSWSTKPVLPTLASDLGYGDLEAGDGSAAQHACLEAIAPATTAPRREELRRHRLACCERSTLALVQLARWRREALTADWPDASHAESR